MPTKWVVTTPVDRIELDESQQGQTTFTVTNPTGKVDRVYFDVVVGDGAEESWFTIDEPQRRVPANGSVSYLIRTNVPAGAKPGTYSVQARAYSADSAPEEDSVLSSRLAVEVKPKAAPVAKKKFPWWIVVVAALAVIVLVVVGILVFGGGGGPAATPAAEQVTVPDVAKQSPSQARTNLGAFGLTVGKVEYKFDANNPDQVIYQSVAGGSKAARGSAVDLVVTSTLAAPKITAPQPNSTVPAAAVQPPTAPLPSNAPSAPATATATATAKPTAAPPTGLLTWTDPDAFVSHWQVTVMQEMCSRSPFIPPFQPPVALPNLPIGCWNQVVSVTRLDAPAFTPILPPATSIGQPGIVILPTSTFFVNVAAVDDFGNTGPASSAVWFTVK